MDTPLYKLYLFKRTPVYFETETEQIADFRRQMCEAQQAQGVYDLFEAEMAWSNEQYEFFGVEYYPNREAVETFAHSLSEMGFYRYTQGESYLGIPMDNNFPDFERVPSIPGQSPIYRLYFTRPASSAVLVSQKDRDMLLTRNQEMSENLGIKTLLSAYMRWNCEAWDYFGIERFPSLETLITYSQFLSDSDWYRIADSISYLGIASSGLVSGCAG